MYVCTYEHVGKELFQGLVQLLFQLHHTQGEVTASHVGKGLNPWFKFHVFCTEQAQLTSQGRFSGTYLKSFGKSVVEHIGATSYILVKE